MRLETVSKVKGWVSLVCLSIWIGVATFMPQNPPRAELIAVSGLAGLVSIILGVSWLRGRRRIREIDYAGRALARGR